MSQLDIQICGIIRQIFIEGDEMARFVEIQDGDTKRWINIEKISSIDFYQINKFKVIVWFSRMENDITFDGIEMSFDTEEEAKKVIEKLIEVEK